MQDAEYRMKIMDGSQFDNALSKIISSIVIPGFVLCVLLFTGCATPSAKLPEPPSKYIYSLEKPEVSVTANSLWNDSLNIFEDRKAKGLNDLLTINIIESLSGSGKADTATSRNSSVNYEITKLLGMDTDLNLQSRSLLRHLYKGGATFEPSIAASGKSDFKGKGDTNREGELIATITAKVVEVMPNGNLIVEARKELTINEETQILVLAGMVRPDDIDANNTIMSNKIADARIYYVGDGVIQDKQKPGWLARGIDKVWPF